MVHEPTSSSLDAVMRETEAEVLDKEQDVYRDRHDTDMINLQFANCNKHALE